MSIYLMPCPLCGSNNIDPEEWMSGDGKTGPGCADCGCCGQDIAAWNKRPIELALHKRIDEITEQLSNALGIDYESRAICLLEDYDMLEEADKLRLRIRNKSI